MSVFCYMIAISILLLNVESVTVETNVKENTLIIKFSYDIKQWLSGHKQLTFTPDSDHHIYLLENDKFVPFSFAGFVDTQSNNGLFLKFTNTETGKAKILEESSFKEMLNKGEVGFFDDNVLYGADSGKEDGMYMKQRDALYGLKHKQFEQKWKQQLQSNQDAPAFGKLPDKKKKDRQVYITHTKHHKDLTNTHTKDVKVVVDNTNDFEGPVVTISNIRLKKQLTKKHGQFDGLTEFKMSPNSNNMHIYFKRSGEFHRYCFFGIDENEKLKFVPLHEDVNDDVCFEPVHDDEAVLLSTDEFIQQCYERNVAYSTHKHLMIGPDKKDVKKINAQAHVNEYEEELEQTEEQFYNQQRLLRLARKLGLVY